MQDKSRAQSAVLLSLSLPIIIENLLRQLVGTVNVYIVGSYSDAAAAAVGVSNQIITLVLNVCTLTAVGAASAISQFLGAGERHKASRLSTVVFSLFLLIGLAISAVLALFAKPILQMMNLDSSLLPLGIPYLQLAGGAVFLQITIAALSAIARSYGNTKSAMTATIIMNGLNLIGSWLVVFRPIEIPLHGVAGVGTVQVISELAAAVFMTLYVFRKMDVGIKFRYLKEPLGEDLKVIFRYGVPSAMESLSYNIAQLLSTSFIASLGAAAVSARVYLLNIVNFSFMIGLSIGQGVQILTGRYIGAKDYEAVEKLHRRAYVLMVASNLLVSLLFALLRYPLLGIFTKSEEIIAMAAPILFLDMVVQTGRAVEYVSLYSLRGAGDVNFTMKFSVASAFIINIGIGYLCSVILHMGLTGIWIGFAADEWMRAIFFMRHWASGKWKQKSVV